jgi:hypothetical protein
MEVMPVRKSEAAIAIRAGAIATATEGMTGAKAAATEHGAAAVKGRAATATAMETSAAAMSATSTEADFSGQSVREIFYLRNGAGIARRQRFRALAGRDRQRQHRDRRKTQTTDKAAPGMIWNRDHA